MAYKKSVSLDIDFFVMPDLYNLKRAKQLNYLPDSIGHLPSRDYKTGLLLKHPAHPTFKKGLEEDKKLGYTPMMDMFGNVYTVSPNDIPTEGYFSPNKTNTQMKNTFATGGQMRNATNSQFVPSYVNGVPVYGFGSWLGKNAGNLLQVAGGIGAMFIPGAQPLGISMMASGAGGIAGQAVDDKNQKADEAEQRAEAEKQFMLNQYNDSQQYFTNGGMIPSMSRGGFMEGLKFYNDGGNLDNVTNFPVGGTHETNPRGGIPLGNNALVEEGEYVYNFPKQGKYVFSNRY